jgi:hypothetical protein|tara:strand:- start:962 stop:1135 length:174 start_codon:yes stop_codon:yes gene_type:complete
MKKSRNIKKNKHDSIIKDYDTQKQKHLERLATKMLKDEDKNIKLKGKIVKGDFLNKF